MEAWSRGRWGDLGEVNAERGTAGGSRVTPPRTERTHRVRKSLKP
jgi:hypothetical protein